MQSPGSLSTVRKTIFFLCRKLENKVVVEGVENKTVDDIIRSMGADYLQGYYYSKPVCKADFEKMLSDSLKD